MSKINITLSEGNDYYEALWALYEHHERYKQLEPMSFACDFFEKICEGKDRMEFLIHCFTVWDEMYMITDTALTEHRILFNYKLSDEPYYSTWEEFEEQVEGKFIDQIGEDLENIFNSIVPELTNGHCKKYANEYAYLCILVQCFKRLNGK